MKHDPSNPVPQAVRERVSAHYRWQMKRHQHDMLGTLKDRHAEMALAGHTNALVLRVWRLMERGPAQGDLFGSAAA